jgi:hypothetical protein
VERFHGTFRPDFLDAAEPFTSLEAAQAAVDAWVAVYNAERPHQALDPRQPVTPQQRFAPIPPDNRNQLELWLPPLLIPSPTPPAGGDTVADATPAASSGGPVEFDRVVPPSGNMLLAGRQVWLGPARAGEMVRFWADVDLIHLFIAGTRVKTLRSHLSVNDLAGLVASGAVPAGPSPLPPIENGDAVEVERCVNTLGQVSLGGHRVLAAEILAGRQVGIRIEAALLLFYDLSTRELLRTRANPLTPAQIKKLRGLRPAGPPPRPSTEPIRVQRRASATGVILVAGQRVALGRVHQHQTVTVLVSETTLAVELADGDTKIISRTTTQPVRSIKGQRPRTATNIS